MRVEKPVHLYWITVPDDPGEDWFVFATQAHLARAFFEDSKASNLVKQKCG
jgi:hypothetical protein